MVEVIRHYTQKLPAHRFVGKLYRDEDRVDGGFGKQWGEWHANGWFSELEALLPDGAPLYEDADAYLGLMRWKEGDPFQYWIGMVVPADTAVPDGYGFVDFGEMELAVTWLKGPESEVFNKDEMAWEPFEKDGVVMKTDADCAFWFAERYACPRFTEPDAECNIILDNCYYLF